MVFSEYHGILIIPCHFQLCHVIFNFNMLFSTLTWYSQNDKVILKITRVDEPGLRDFFETSLRLLISIIEAVETSLTV